MNKLSELSKPIAWTTQQELIDSGNGVAWVWLSERALYGEFPLYSQEYVSAMLAELEASQLALKNVTELWNEQRQRIAELEAKLSEMTTFRDNALNKALRYWEELLELRAKLATPVRLPELCGDGENDNEYTEGREEWANVEGEIIDNLAMLIRLVIEGDQVIGFTPPDACRAAMLAQPVSQGCNWIACGEQLPAVGETVLVSSDGYVSVGESERSGANYRYFTSVATGRELTVTHWMPLPAAPEGGNEK